LYGSEDDKDVKENDDELQNTKSEPHLGREKRKK